MDQNNEINEKELAQAVGRSMFERDNASRSLGMRITSIGPGHAVMEMTVRDDMLNGHGTCQGGFMFTLADSAFAFACNSYNRNTVASSCSIDFLAPACKGEVLIADAREMSRSGRTGVYDVNVLNQAGVRVALFRGKSYEIKGAVIPMST
ncbi:MAG: hydroxyphenylacetyl-CoA thioesterase PaaI [Burkholderiaceae bacterium]